MKMKTITIKIIELKFNITKKKKKMQLRQKKEEVRERYD